MPLRTLTILCAFLLVMTSSLSFRAQEDKPFLIPVSLQVEQVEVVLGVGEKIKGFALPGGLGGLAAAKQGDGTLVMLAAHALPGAPPATLWDVRPHPDPGGMLFVVRSGKEAGKEVAFQVAGPVCAAGADEGIEQPMFLLGDEAPGGGAAVVAAGKAYPFPGLGRFAKGGLLFLQGTGQKTVVAGFENAPDRPDSHLYFFLGEKSPSGGDLVDRAGLSKGTLYAFKAEGLSGLAQLREKGKKVRFVLVPVKGDQDAGSLAKEARDKGAAGFAGLAAGVQLPSDPRTLCFASRGSDARDERSRYVDHNGRVYKLVFDDVANPAGGGTLEVLLTETDGILGPSAVAADNRGRMLVAEAPTFPTPGRDTSVWLFDPASSSLVRMLETSPAAAGRSDPPGTWAVKSLREASGLLGEDGWWLLTVDSRTPSGAGAPAGQILAVHTNILNLK